MTTEPRSHEPAGGDGLLFIIAMAIVAVVTLEGVFIAFPGWWLLGVVLAVVILAAAGVSASLVRLIDHGTPFARSHAQPESEPEPAAAEAARRAPRPRPRVIAH
jgi:hypothetical protein